MTELLSSPRLRLFCQDLERVSLVETVIPAPYTENETVEKQVEVTYRALQRACRIKNRVLALLNAFYLGQLIETRTSNPLERTIMKNMLTPHYRTIAIRTYYLFEFLGPLQIHRTCEISLAMIRCLKVNEFQALIQHAPRITSTNEENFNFLSEFEN